MDRVGWVLTLAGVILLCQAMGCQFIGELGQGNVTYLSLLRLEKTKILKMLKLRLHYKEPLENKYVLT